MKKFANIFVSKLYVLLIILILNFTLLSPQVSAATKKSNSSSLLSSFSSILSNIDFDKLGNLTAQLLKGSGQIVKSIISNVDLNNLSKKFDTAFNSMEKLFDSIKINIDSDKVEQIFENGSNNIAKLLKEAKSNISKDDLEKLEDAFNDGFNDLFKYIKTNKSKIDYSKIEDAFEDLFNGINTSIKNNKTNLNATNFFNEIADLFNNMETSITTNSNSGSSSLLNTVSTITENMLNHCAVWVGQRTNVHLNSANSAKSDAANRGYTVSNTNFTVGSALCFTSSNSYKKVNSTYGHVEAIESVTATTITTSYTGASDGKLHYATYNKSDLANASGVFNVSTSSSTSKTASNFLSKLKNFFKINK